MFNQYQPIFILFLALFFVFPFFSFIMFKFGFYSSDDPFKGFVSSSFEWGQNLTSSSSLALFQVPGYAEHPDEHFSLEDVENGISNEKCRIVCYNFVRDTLMKDDDFFNKSIVGEMDFFIAQKGSLRFMYMCKQNSLEQRCLFRKDCGFFSCTYSKRCELCSECYVARACWEYCQRPKDFEESLLPFKNMLTTAIGSGNDEGEGEGMDSKKRWLHEYFLASFRQRCFNIDHKIEKLCRKKEGNKDDYAWKNWYAPNSETNQKYKEKFSEDCRNA